MPSKKNSQVLISTQVSNNHASSSDDQDDTDDNFENDTNFKQVVCASVQYILMNSSKAPYIKRLDWINTVLRPMGLDGRKHFPSVHKHVVKGLENTFGYKLAILDEKHDGKKRIFFG